MGIYLPDMEMPRKGQMLVIFPDGTSYVCFNGMRERLAQTKAVPVPPHGRLGDLDALHKRMKSLVKQAENDGFDLGAVWYSTFVRHIELAPTIIPAEED